MENNEPEILRQLEKSAEYDRIHIGKHCANIPSECREEARVSSVNSAAKTKLAILRALGEQFLNGATVYELAHYLRMDITHLRPRCTDMADPLDGTLSVIGKRVNPEFSRIACSVYQLSCRLKK